VLRRFLDQQRELAKDTNFDPAAYPVCEIEELVVGSKSCADSEQSGWCYVKDEPARKATGDRCKDAILFSPKGNPRSGSRVFLQCIERLPN
jgi:hypothetical protein